MNSGGTIYVDHATKLIFISSQVNLIAADTVSGKKDFERLAAGYGVNIQQYNGDNRIFKSKLWVDHYESMHQLPTEMSVVGAHHQNTIVERSIGTIVCSAQTMMLHTAIYWLEVSNLMLWQFALSYAVDLWSMLSDIGMGLSPLDKFGGTLTDHSDLLDAHMWGCPAYVLESTLQDGKKLPKWNPCKCHGQFLGWSKQHASTVALI
eukprot:15365253-Ditylum_brightwellii.AAC.3